MRSTLAVARRNPHLAQEDAAALFAQSSGLEGAGDLAGARSAAVEGLAVAQGGHLVEAELEFRIQIARLAEYGGDLAEALRFLVQGLAALKRSQDDVRISLYLSSLAYHLFHAGDFERGVAYSDEAAQYAVGVDRADRFRLVTLLEANLLSGRVGEAVALARKLQPVSARMDAAGEGSDYLAAFDGFLVATAFLEAAFADLESGRPPDGLSIRTALDLLEAGLARARRGAPVLVEFLITHRAAAHAFLGETDADGVALVRSLGPDGVALRGEANMHGLARWGMLEAVHRGNPELGRRILDACRPAANGEPRAWHGRWYEASARVHEAGGAFRDACTDYRARLAVSQWLQTRLAEARSRVSADLAEAEWRRYRDRRALERAARLQAQNQALTEERQKLVAAAFTDPLTGIGNRRYIESSAREVTQEKAWVRTVVMIDVDHFKAVNDGFSHQVGDAVLGAIGAILKSSVRRLDLVARYGGEEFIAVFSGAVSDSRLEALRAAVEDHDWEAIAPGLAVTASFGAVTWTETSTFQEAVRAADERLYRAKRSGRNRVVRD